MAIRENVFTCQYILIGDNIHKRQGLVVNKDCTLSYALRLSFIRPKNILWGSLTINTSHSVRQFWLQFKHCKNVQ